MEENKDPQLNNLPPTNFDAPKGSNSKLIFSVVAIFVVILIIGFFVYKSYFPKSPSSVESPTATPISSTPEITAKAGYSLYKDETKALLFEYLKNLFLTDKGEINKVIYPVITFEKPNLNVNFSQGNSIALPLDTNSCPIDCVAFSAFLDNSNGGGGLNSVFQRTINNQEAFPKFISPAYVYQDETGSKPFKINGLNAVRFYAAGDIGETIEERVYITDNKVPNRLLYVVYREHIKSEQRLDSPKLSSSIIKNLFDSQKHATYQTILSSVRTLSIDLSQLSIALNGELGVSFKYPKYWGDFQAQAYTGALDNPSLQGVNLSFSSPLYAGEDSSGIQMEAHNKESAAYVYEGSPRVWQYYGQPLEAACQNKAYLDPSNANQVKLSECNIKTLPNGLKLVLFKGSLTYAPGLGDNPSPSKYFMGAILQTKSLKQPGMTIHFESTTQTSDLEKTFNKIIDSLSYSK